MWLAAAAGRESNISCRLMAAGRASVISRVVGCKHLEDLTLVAVDVRRRTKADARTMNLTWKATKPFGLLGTDQRHR
jgi:hypothetical protein